MRTPQRILAVITTLVVGACATSDVPESQYDEVARVVGAGLSGADHGGELGAFTDSAMLARDQLPDGFKREFGLVSGRRGDFEHRYFVVCVDARGFAIDPCGPSAERALVFAAWSGPLDTATHEGVLRRGGYWTIANPWRATTTIAGDTWFEYDAGAYRIDDYRDVLLVVEVDYRAITAGGMTARITVEDGVSEPVGIVGDVELTFRSATITLDGVHTTEVALDPLLIR